MSYKLNFSILTNEVYKNLHNFEITYGFMNSQFGLCIIGINYNKLCYIAFHDEGMNNSAIKNLQNDWPNAVLKENSNTIKTIAKQIFNVDETSKSELDILLRGTDFQVNVWKELINIKLGCTTNYEAVAHAIGKPKAVRAVANAISKNKIAYVIPCHRVIQKDGNIGKYRWGVQCKKEMLTHENVKFFT